MFFFSRICLKAVALLLVFAVVGCGESPESELKGTWYVQAKFGKWMPLELTETRSFGSGGTLTIALDDEGSDVEFAEHKVKWEIVGQWRMRIYPPEDSDAPAHDVLYRIEGDTLTLADAAGDTILTRDKGPSEDRKAAWEAVLDERE